MFALQTQSDNFVVMKCSLCSHEVKRALIFMRFDRTSLAKRLHFSCTEGALNLKSTCKCKCFFGSPCWTRTNDPFGQKHSRLARLERFAMLLVSSCSEHRFICRRQRGAPSQLTVVVTRISNSVIRFHAV